MFVLGSHILALWENRSKNLNVVAAWAFSVQLKICSNTINWLTGSQHLQVEQVLAKLHKKHCPYLDVINETIEDIVDIFWMEFKKF